ncbi:MAG: hypothetical protein NXH86_07000 [Flavobacteriaceae bacterium]|jgi:hypothetical protein|uniref:hypothetical protein n=1 Tax=Flagellimonas sp. SN16 TaxID=3415142 RepID=UPI000E2893B0|nr:hypothetical protein [Allomuricauda sp.]MCR9263889.1 hypothetical protein [Flavobacteriaceae bacterium]
MSKEKKIILKEAEITNNCPECFNQELMLTFYQKHTFGTFFHVTTNEVTHEIKCKKCQSIIYPVSWTPDIERVFDYYNKLVTPERSSIRFTTLFFVVLIVAIGIVAATIYLYLEGLI